MEVMVKMKDINTNLTEEELKELEEAEKKEICYDDDSPQMTPTMLKQFTSVSKLI